MRHTSYSLTKIALSLSLVTTTVSLGVSVLDHVAALACAAVGLVVIAVVLLVAHRRDVAARSQRGDKSS